MDNVVQVTGNGADASAAAPAGGQTLQQMQEALSTQANRLGGRWHFSRATIVPSESALAGHARRKGIAVLPRWSMILIGCIYYALITALSSAYGLIVADLQAWEPPLSWVGGGALALAFWGASLLVWVLWKRGAIASLRADDPRAVLALAIAVTIVALAIDFAASYMLMSASLRDSFLGVAILPALVVWLLAGVTTLAQVAGAVYGWLVGLRHEAITDWWNEVVEQRANELDALRRVAYAIERRREEDRIRRPRGHVASGR